MRRGGMDRMRNPVLGAFTLSRACRAGVVLAGALLVGMTAGWTASSAAQTHGARADLTDPALPHRLQAMLDRLVREGENVRNGALLIEGPGFHWMGASGVAFAGSGIAMQPDDSFNLDSMVKMMTATIVMKLVESGRLGLDDPIAKYLPESLMAGLHVCEGRDYSDEITVRHLLSHSSGLADDWADPSFLNLIIEDQERRWTPEATVEYIKKNCTPHFPPGDGFQYSDPGYNLLGLVIERRTGRPLHQVFRELLLAPCGMNHTYRPSHEAPRPSLPGRGPSERFLDDMECTLVPAVLTADWAGGGMISTTEDVNRFLRAFVRNEIFEDPSTRGRMFRWIESGPYHGYGFGISRVLFDRSPNPDHKGLGEIWGHAGSSHCFAFYWPREGITMIGTLNQLAYDGSLYDTLALVMQTILGRKNISRIG